MAKVGPTPIVRMRSLACRDLRGQAGERIEQRRQAGLVGAAGGRDEKPVCLPLEQRYPEPVLEEMHHSADRGRRHVQLSARAGEAAASGGRLECLDAVEKGQPAHC